MICDSVDALHFFYKGSDAWKLAVDFLDGLTDNVEEGKHVIDGDKVFAFVSRYDTRSVDGADMEIHEKYADIQILLEGEELIGWQAKDENLPLTVEYSPENDIAFYAAGEFSTIKLRPGVAAVYLPKEYHMPQLKVGDRSEPVTKVVVKIDASLL